MRLDRPEIERDGNAKTNRSGNHPRGRVLAGRGQRLIIGLLTFALVLVPLTSVAAGLPQAGNLQALAHRSARERLPMLVFFYRNSCAYCKEVDELYLKPRYADAAYRSKVIIREVNVDSDRMLRDFSGRMISEAAFAHRYHVSLTPTIEFFGAGGHRLVSPLVGVGNADFYGGYLDAAVAAAGRKMAEHRELGSTAYLVGAAVR